MTSEAATSTKRLALQDWRKLRDKTVMELATAAGIQASRLAALEMGRPISAAEVMGLKKALDLSFDQVMDAHQESKARTDQVVEILNSVADGAPLPAGTVVISCARGKGCKTTRH